MRLATESNRFIIRPANKSQEKKERKKFFNYFYKADFLVHAYGGIFAKIREVCYNTTMQTNLKS